jgi:TonB family protein
MFAMLMLLDKLESGFLLFETPQGLVGVQLSLRQRLYLLWTFRNFRQLSVALLNSRQRALVHALFHNHADVVSHSHDPLLVIGVVEKFVPPPIETLAEKEERQEEPVEEVVAQPAEIAPSPSPYPNPSSSPRFAWSRLAWSKLAWSKVAWSMLATTVGALSLCIVSVAAWHRIQAIPSSQAHNQPALRQINAIALLNSPPAATPVAIAESPTTPAPPAAIAQPLAGQEEASEAAVKQVSIATVIPTPIPAPKRETQIHGATPTPDLPLSRQESGMQASSMQASSVQASRPPMRFVYPVYRDVRARGVVALTARVDSDGAVGAVAVVSGNHALAAAAVRAVRQWRYRPYLKDGQPVPTETNIVISFISSEAISMSFPPAIPASQ